MNQKEKDLVIQQQNKSIRAGQNLKRNMRVIKCLEESYFFYSFNFLSPGMNQIDSNFPLQDFFLLVQKQQSFK